MRLPGIQQKYLRLFNHGGDGRHAENAHRHPPHGAHQAVPHVLLLDVFCDGNAIGTERRYDEIEMIDGVRHSRWVPGDPKKETTAPRHCEDRVTLATMNPCAPGIRGNQPMSQWIPQGATRNPKVC